MTEQPQLKRRKTRCPTCTCPVIWDGYMYSVDTDRALKIYSASCKSRPAPSPEPIRSMREDEDGHISWQQMNEKALAEHDAAIAAQARNKTLDLTYDARIMDLEAIVRLSERLLHHFPDDFSLKFSKQQASDEIKRIESLHTGAPKQPTGQSNQSPPYPGSAAYWARRDSTEAPK